MLSWHSRLRNDWGNAVIEFLFFWVTALVVIVQLSVSVGQDIQRRSAGLSLANESLRTWQLTGNKSDAETAAFFTANTYKIRPDDWRLQFDDLCTTKGVQRVTVSIEGVTQIAQGYC